MYVVDYISEVLLLKFNDKVKENADGRRSGNSNMNKARGQHKKHFETIRRDKWCLHLSRLVATD